MVDLVGQYSKIKDEIDSAIQGVIDSSMFIKGPQVGQFNQALADYLDCKHVIACANGTDAIQLALMALNLEAGDEVITTPFTFVATVEVIALLGLVPKFVDIDPSTFNMDVSKLEAAITDRTKVILPVHLFGQSTDMAALMQVARKHNLYVIEDNAQSIGCQTVGENGEHQASGTIGHFGTISFFPSKNLGCFGDGGAIVSNDDALGKMASIMANHGSERKYYHSHVGINSRLDTMQAAILNVKLKYLPTYTLARQAAANRYDELLASVIGVVRPVRSTYSTHVFHQYTLRIPENRDGLKAYLAEHDIPSMVYYPHCLHLQPAYTYCGYKQGDFPEAELAAQEVLSLPMHTELTLEMQDSIVKRIQKYIDMQ